MKALLFSACNLPALAAEMPAALKKSTACLPPVQRFA
jgi:hypothetical protein